MKTSQEGVVDTLFVLGLQPASTWIDEFQAVLGREPDSGDSFWS